MERDLGAGFTAKISDVEVRDHRAAVFPLTSHRFE
jgi:hypothetical protein